MEDPQNNQPNTELEETKKNMDEYLNNWKRAAADLINYKKGEIERAGMLVGYAKEGTFSNILPVLDSIYLAAAAFGKDGFTQIEKQILEFLKKEGIEEIKTLGEPFNPATMEVMTEVDGEGIKPGMVAEEIQKGYKIGDKVIRPVKVSVTK